MAYKAVSWISSSTISAARKSPSTIKFLYSSTAKFSAVRGIALDKALIAIIVRGRLPASIFKTVEWSTRPI
jgi:hypothetical protein